jgi:hypothetical protein
VLTVRQYGVVRPGFEVLDEAGRLVAAFSGSARTEHGDIAIGDGRWHVRRMTRGHFVLESPSGVLAHADRTSAWSGRWELHAAGRTYDLVRRSWHSRVHELREAGRPVGTVEPRGPFSRHATATLPSTLPLPEQVFVIAVVLTIWRRDQQAAATSGSG